MLVVGTTTTLTQERDADVEGGNTKDKVTDSAVQLSYCSGAASATAAVEAEAGINQPSSKQIYLVTARNRELDQMVACSVAWDCGVVRNMPGLLLLRGQHAVI